MADTQSPKPSFNAKHRRVKDFFRATDGPPSPEEIWDALFSALLNHRNLGIDPPKREALWAPELPASLAVFALRQPLFQYNEGILLFVEYEQVAYLYVPQRDRRSATTFPGILWPDQISVGPDVYQAWLAWALGALWGFGPGTPAGPPPLIPVELDLGPVLHQHLWDRVREGGLRGDELAGTLALLDTLFRFPGHGTKSLDRSKVVLSAEDLPEEYRRRMPRPIPPAVPEPRTVEDESFRAVAYSYKWERIDGSFGHRDRLSEITLAIGPKEWRFAASPLWEEVKEGMEWS